MLDLAVEIEIDLVVTERTGDRCEEMADGEVDLGVSGVHVPIDGARVRGPLFSIAQVVDAGRKLPEGALAEREAWKMAEAQVAEADAEKIQAQIELPSSMLKDRSFTPMRGSRAVDPPW